MIATEGAARKLGGILKDRVNGVPEFHYNILGWKFAVDANVSLFTPISANGSSASRCTNDRSCGYMARQGPHQSPQKSSTTTFPR